jgi:hypothetical protein
MATGIWVHSQYNDTKNRPYNNSIHEETIRVDDVVQMIGEAFASLPKSVQEAEVSQRGLASLRDRIYRLRGVSATGNGFGRNWMSAQMSDDWHIDVELSGTVQFI